MTFHEFTYLHLDESGREYEWLISFTYHPGDPGYLRGLAEDCWPPEQPELEITSISEQGIALSGRAFSSNLNDKLEAAAWEYLDRLSDDFDPS